MLSLTLENIIIKKPKYLILHLCYVLSLHLKLAFYMKKTVNDVCVTEFLHFCYSFY